MKKGFLKPLLFLTICGAAVGLYADQAKAGVAASGISAVLQSYIEETLHLSAEDKEEPIIAPLSYDADETEATEADEAVSEAAETESVTEAGTENTTEAVTESSSEPAVEAETEEGAVAEAAVDESPVSAGAGEVTAEAEPASTVCGYTNIGIADIEGNLNIRKEPSEEAELCGKLPAEAACEILGESGEWYHIKSGEVEGFVKAEFLTTGEEAKTLAESLKSTVAVVTADVLNVREQPNTDCEIVDQIATDEEVPLIENMGEWLKVDVDGEERYVKAEFVRIDDVLKDALTMTEVQYGEGVSDVRVAVVNYATQFVGNRYVWGGTSLTNGCDCSGFVLSVMANFGVYLPHHSGSQALCGTRISCDELQPGDLVFYGGRRISHVAMYIGGGRIVHAANSRVGITISNLYYRTPTCCTRVLYT